MASSVVRSLNLRKSINILFKMHQVELMVALLGFDLIHGGCAVGTSERTFGGVS